MNVYLYCSTPQKHIRARIEEDTGVKIKKVINDVNKIKEHAMILFLDDGGVPLDFNFKKEDVILVDEYMDFDRWLSFYKSGVKVVCYKDGFESLTDHFLEFGVEGKANVGINRGILNKKSEIKDAVKLRGSRLVGIYSIGDKDVSSIALNTAYILKQNSENQSIVVVDLSFKFSDLGYFIAKKDQFSKMDTNNSYLTGYNMETYKDDQIYVISHNFLNDEYVLTDKKGVYINVIYSIIKHFDVIVINIPYEVNKETIDLLNLCTDLLVHVGGNMEKNKQIYERIIKPYLSIEKVTELDLEVGYLEMWQEDSSKYREIKKLLESLNLLKSKKYFKGFK